MASVARFGFRFVRPLGNHFFLFDTILLEEGVVWREEGRAFMHQRMWQ